jgi:hypothetical protein
VTSAQRAELLRLRSAHPKLYVRERAAAILQLAEGKTLGVVAEQGLLKPHQLETVSTWAKRYLAEGAAGLEMRSGRGRKRGKRLLPFRST